MQRWSHTVGSEEKLAQLFDAPAAAASQLKEMTFGHPVYRALLEASPFFALATSGPGSAKRWHARASSAPRAWCRTGFLLCLFFIP